MVWLYTNVLNQDLQILIEIAVALVSTLYGPFDLGRNLLTLKLLVFNVLLPSGGVTNLGFVSDFRDGSIWRFCGAFLMMRAIMLALHMIWAAIFKRRFEDIAVNWLVTCWVSSSILAPPLLQAVFGTEYEVFGYWSDVSSFIFQLPIALLFFEIDAITRAPIDHGKLVRQIEPTGHHGVYANGHSLDDNVEQYIHESAVSDGCQVVLSQPFYKSWRLTKKQAKVVLWNLAKAPLMWAVLGGTLLSVTTLGPRYLYPGTSSDPNCDYVEYTGFIFLFFSSLAKCLEPLALFSVGIVLSKNNPFTCGIWNIIGYMLIKLIFVPLLMIGCAFSFGLSDMEGRAAVLIALLPVSPPAFALTGHFGVGLAEAVSTILIGKALVIPTILAWQAVMDSLNLFPYAGAPTTNTQCT